MNEGRIEQVGSPSDVYDRPATPFVAGFVGAANVLKGLVIGGKVQFGEHHVQGAADLLDGTAADAYVRPHDVSISQQRVNAGDAAATVDRVANLGWTSRVTLVLADGQRIIAELPNDYLNGLQPGSIVYVDLRGAKVFKLQGVPSDELAGF
jgi:sulfate transport system ATP-binding protein